MSENRNSVDKRVMLGGILIFLGGIFLLNSMNVLNFRFAHVVFSWPFIMLVIGSFILINTEKKFLGGVLSGIGIIFLIPRIFPYVDYDAGIVIPILLIVLGTHIILKKRRFASSPEHPFDASNVNKDKIDDVSIFGGGTKIISSNNFQGGNVTAIFGGSEINLMNCQLADGDNILDVLCIFGGTTIIVPKEWNVVINVTSVLGGFSNKAIRNPSIVVDQSKTLHIKGLAMFGGGEVKTYL